MTDDATSAVFTLVCVYNSVTVKNHYLNHDYDYCRGVLISDQCLYTYIYIISYLTQVLSDFKAMIRRVAVVYGDLSQYSTAQQVAATTTK